MDKATDIAVKIRTIDQGDEVAAWMSEQAGLPVSHSYMRNPTFLPFIGVMGRSQITDGPSPDYFGRKARKVYSYDEWKRIISGDDIPGIISRAKAARIKTNELIYGRI